MQYEDVDLTWQWFQCARGLNIPVSGPLMQEKALRFAETLSHVDFKGSSGWLDCFKARHNIVSSTICGEKGSVNADTVSDWKDKRIVFNKVNLRNTSPDCCIHTLPLHGEEQPVVPEKITEISTTITR